MDGKIDLGGFPSSKDKKDKEGAQVYDHSQDYIQLSRRVKVLEESINNLRRKILVNEQNDLNRNKKLLSEQKSTLEEINELKKEIENMKRIMKEFISELRTSAKKEEVDVLKKYVDLWDPIKFVTEEVVERIIDEKLSDLKKEE
jgi:hypothetical protein|tara:strand:- start:2073 stop:2504 length:432 start_codon:yes stop_codon:yes gene_type:complete